MKKFNKIILPVAFLIAPVMVNASILEVTNLTNKTFICGVMDNSYTDYNMNQQHFTLGPKGTYSIYLSVRDGGRGLNGYTSIQYGCLQEGESAYTVSIGLASSLNMSSGNVDTRPWTFWRVGNTSSAVNPTYKAITTSTDGIQHNGPFSTAIVSSER